MSACQMANDLVRQTYIANFLNGVCVDNRCLVLVHQRKQVLRQVLLEPFVISSNERNG